MAGGRVFRKCQLGVVLSFAVMFVTISWAAFKRVGQQAVVMGDMVLLEDQVNPVMSGSSARSGPPAMGSRSTRDTGGRSWTVTRRRNCGPVSPGIFPWAAGIDCRMRR